MWTHLPPGKPKEIVENQPRGKFLRPQLAGSDEYLRRYVQTTLSQFPARQHVLGVVRCEFLPDNLLQPGHATEMKQASAILILVGILSSHLVFAQSKSPNTRKIVEQYEIPGTTDVLEMILIEYQPGAAAPPHLHPVVGLNYIIEGTAESQYEGESLKTFHAGDTYQDPANKKHLIFRNPSKTESLKFLVACQIPKGQSFPHPSRKVGSSSSLCCRHAGFCAIGYNFPARSEGRLGREFSNPQSNPQFV